MSKPWVVLGPVLNQFTGIMRAFAVYQSKRSAKTKRSHRNRRAAMRRSRP